MSSSSSLASTSAVPRSATTCKTSKPCQTQGLQLGSQATCQKATAGLVMSATAQQMSGSLSKGSGSPMQEALLRRLQQYTLQRQRTTQLDAAVHASLAADRP